MKDQLPALIIIILLSVALLAPLISLVSFRLFGFGYLLGYGRLLQIIVFGAVLASHLCSVALLIRTISEGPWHYWFGRWEPPWGIEYVIDPLSAGMAVLITFIGMVVLVSFRPFFNNDVSWLRKGIVYALYLLTITGLVGMVLTGDVFNLFVFLEIASLSTYALVASGGPKAAVSAFYYVLVGTVGASLYLLGVGYLYAVTGSLNMADLSEKLQPLASSPAVMTAIIMIVIGIGLKMALFPMHGWLPDVYANAPPPITAFISSVMGKVYVYVLLRLFFFIFGFDYGPVPLIMNVLGVAAAAGIIVTSVMAIGQKDVRRMLAYSSIAQIGYIVLGLTIGNALALIGVMLHMLNHAFMKCCLFLVAGGVKLKTDEHDLPFYAGLNKTMPLSMGAFLIAALSMIGLPPAAGFFSKWYLLQGTIAAGRWPYVAVIIVGGLLSAVYFFKVLEQIYLKKPEIQALPESEAKKSCWELPPALLVPIVIMGIGILALGIFNESIVTQVLQYAMPGRGW